MLESIKKLHKELVSLERQVDRAECKGGECITITIEEADNLIRTIYKVVFDDIDENPELLEVVK